MTAVAHGWILPEPRMREENGKRLLARWQYSRGLRRGRRRGRSGGGWLCGIRIYGSVNDPQYEQMCRWAGAASAEEFRDSESKGGAVSASADGDIVE